MQLDLKVTRVFDFIWNSTKRYVVLQGGTRSSKSWSIMQWILVTCLNADKPMLVSIVRKTLPSLKKSVYRDFIDMLDYYGLYDPELHNKTDNIIKIGQCTIEFISLDQSQKIRGAKRDICWINECNETPYESFFQLQIRTSQKVLLDYNPTEMVGWWIDLKDNRKDEVDFDISTYRDNPFLEPVLINEIERLKEVDPDYYQIYNLGIASRSIEAVFQYNIVNDIPVDEAQLIALGLDWGFSNDPTALVEVWKKDDNLYINEVLYRNGMTNQDIAEYMKEIGVNKQIDIIADSSEPKSVEEVRRYGFRIHPAKKSADSIRNSIDILKRHKLYITAESTNIIKEFQLYKWKRDPNGVLLNVPLDMYNHAIDATRYVALNLLSNKNKGQYNITVGGMNKLFPVANDDMRQTIKKYNIR